MGYYDNKNARFNPRTKKFEEFDLDENGKEIGGRPWWRTTLSLILTPWKH